MCVVQKCLTLTDEVSSTTKVNTLLLQSAGVVARFGVPSFPLGKRPPVVLSKLFWHGAKVRVRVPVEHNFNIFEVQNLSSQLL